MKPSKILLGTLRPTLIEVFENKDFRKSQRNFFSINFVVNVKDMAEQQSAANVSQSSGN